jgi:hypothetical protein
MRVDARLPRRDTLLLAILLALTVLGGCSQRYFVSNVNPAWLLP